jgi:hypothetical protein
MLLVAIHNQSCIAGISWNEKKAQEKPTKNMTSDIIKSITQLQSS